jgi:hypothetical protein
MMINKEKGNIMFKLELKKWLAFLMPPAFISATGQPANMYSL